MEKSPGGPKQASLLPFWGKILFFLFVFYLFLMAGCQVMNAELHNTQGVKYLQEQKYDLALSEFEGARLQAPEAPNAYYNIASTYHQLGIKNHDTKMYSMAEQYYRLCLTKAPNHTPCHRGLAVLLVETARSEEAFALLRSWESRNSGNADPKIEMARLFQELGQKEEAAKYLKSAIAVNPNETRAYNALAMLQESNGDYENALENYKSSIASVPNQTEIVSKIAFLENRTGLANPAAPTAPTILVPDSMAEPPQTASRDLMGPRF
ncbi:MAG: tetratricopeptide repeat protein [Planctomycetaceae bacterium]|jgi:tetratricopeptide (TPR) repeat protein|nr:tetratricopeptide repeat protein [Planctomycetaceae bacterium]